MVVGSLVAGIDVRRIVAEILMRRSAVAASAWQIVVELDKLRLSPKTGAASGATGLSCVILVEMKLTKLGASVFTLGLVVIGNETDRLSPRESFFVDRKTEGEPMLSKIRPEGK